MVFGKSYINSLNILLYELCGYKYSYSLWGLESFLQFYEFLPIFENNYKNSTFTVEYAWKIVRRKGANVKIM